MRRIYLILIFFLLPLSLNGQWIQQNVPSGIGIILSIDFQNSLTGVAGGWIDQGPFNGKIIYTNNSGSLWSFGSLPDSARAIVSVQYISGNTYYSSGAYNTSSLISNRISTPENYPSSHKRKLENIGLLNAGGNTRGYFLKSTNNGVNWFPYGSLPPGIEYITSMDFADENVGYMVAERGNFDASILKTINSGLNWLEIPFADSIRLNSLNFLNSTTGFAVGFRFEKLVSKGYLLRTTSGGSQWQGHVFNELNDIVDINFPNSNTGFLIGYDTSVFSALHLYKTTNSGINWFRSSSSFNTLVGVDVEFIPSTGTGVVMGLDFSSLPEKTLFYKTTDFGNNWKRDSIMTDKILIGMDLLDQNNWYVGGGIPFDQAAIFHTTTGGSVFIEQVGGVIPQDYQLEQNYPNPFNPVTNIKFSVPAASFISLKVYDLLGREVANLVNEKLSPGNFEVQFSGQNLNSGIYFYRLHSDDSDIVKKMILIK